MKLGLVISELVRIISIGFSSRELRYCLCSVFAELDIILQY